ncbi:hypothetical protein F0562_000329 [Nyssa sinensis]|uniref:Prefoldin subunit 2 n=1 Tax=Nyssa sinensis TaxID=561372 RepID=A0A5J5BZU2_9ASTE|nr:hypothetical protein F0562_000329 [Nyssa sinensis]
MTSMFLRRWTNLTSVVNPHVLSMVCSFTSRASRVLDNTNEASQSLSINNEDLTSATYDSRLHLSPLFSHGRPHSESYKIELVDTETWRVSSGIMEAWRGTDGALDSKASVMDVVDEVDNYSPSNEDPDFDEIEDMRIRGNLFYKLDRDSKEFEEYSFDFHRKKSSKSKDDPKESKASGVGKSSKNKVERRESQKKEERSCNLASASERLPKPIKNESLFSSLHEMNNHPVGKKVRIPTFNQLTAPYHEPFCLDIYITKGSVRASIIHRATSKVVAVAHSISKDFKFELASTKNVTACASVGEVLAQRALGDDIHNVVYTPRKGDKLEGKLQIVLQSIIDNGVNVKVKLKQRRRALGVTQSGNSSEEHEFILNVSGADKDANARSTPFSFISTSLAVASTPRRIMAGKAEGDGKEPINEQAVANIYGALRSEINQIYSKITELEMEVSEHSLVINAIQPLDPSRRCYRMIGGVLVERTIKEVLPAVQRNKEGLEEVIARLGEALEKKKKEIADFEAKYKIRIRKSDEVNDESGRKEGSAQGVLVGPAGANE